MNENVHPSTVLDHVLVEARITRDHDRVALVDAAFVAGAGAHLSLLAAGLETCTRRPRAAARWGDFRGYKAGTAPAPIVPPQGAGFIASSHRLLTLVRLRRARLAETMNAAGS